MDTVQNRTDFDQWWNTVVSCSSQLDNGDDQQVENAKGLLKTITPYMLDWKTKYDNWHSANKST